jgi:hypothetical protein
MIRPHFASAIAIAAMLAAAPAFAASSTKPSAAADQTSKPLCSSFKNPNAGKLADKSTGQAKEHSASPVHEDCIPDSSASSATAGPSSSASASYGGLRDTTSNAQSDMPSTASSSSSGVYANRSTDVNGSANTSQGTSGTQGTTPKMAGDSSTRQ